MSQTRPAGPTGMSGATAPTGATGADSPYLGDPPKTDPAGNPIYDVAHDEKGNPLPDDQQTKANEQKAAAEKKKQEEAAKAQEAANIERTRQMTQKPAE